MIFGVTALLAPVMGQTPNVVYGVGATGVASNCCGSGCVAGVCVCTVTALVLATGAVLRTNWAAVTAVGAPAGGAVTGTGYVKPG